MEQLPRPCEPASRSSRQVGASQSGVDSDDNQSRGVRSRPVDPLKAGCREAADERRGRTDAGVAPQSRDVRPARPARAHCGWSAGAEPGRRCHHSGAGPVVEPSSADHDFHHVWAQPRHNAHDAGPATTSVPTRPPPAPTTSTAIPEDTYANSVDEVCQQFVPQLTQLVTTGIDGGMFNESEVKSLVSQMLSDISAIPAPSGEGPTVNTWIVDWEDSWDAALSENTRLFTSDIRTADATARLLGLGPQCM